MDKMIIAIVALVCGVLSIILFFKVWGMTNDVAEIKEFLKKSHVEKENSEIKIGDVLLDNETNRKMILISIKGNKYTCRYLDNSEVKEFAKDEIE